MGFRVQGLGFRIWSLGCGEHAAQRPRRVSSWKELIVDNLTPEPRTVNPKSTLPNPQTISHQAYIVPTVTRSTLREGLMSQFENNYTEMCSSSEAGSYLRLIDFVYHSTLGLRVIKQKKKKSTHTSSPLSPGARCLQG